MAVAALVLGIISIIFCITPLFNFLAPVVGAVGIILAAVARKNLKDDEQETAIATGGLVTSIIGTALGMLMYIACAACIGGSGMMMKEFTKELQKDPGRIEKAIKKLEQMQKESPTQKEQI